MIFHIAAAFDQNYMQQFCALMSSIFANTKTKTLHFHLITTGISDIEKKLLQDFIELQNSKITFYDFDQQTVEKLVLNDGWTHAAYYRLFFPLLVSPDVKRILYIDTDTIVINDLSTLFNTDLEEYPVGAVYDIYVQEQKLIDVPKGEYFNSGVLLIDVAKWRAQTISERTLTYLQNFPEKILYVDQCGLNAVLKDNWKKLHYGFNVLYTYLPSESSLDELKGFIADKTIVHFTLQRPWDFLCKNRLRFLYWDYLRRSPLTKISVVYNDFSLSKIPDWLNIRLMELYYDNILLQRIWRRIKSLVQ